MFEYINMISKEYPIVGSTISLMTAGGAMYFFKDVPEHLKPFLKKGETKITGAELQERYMKKHIGDLK